MVRLCRCAPAMASWYIFSMPGSRSSKASATRVLSRSTPSMSWVRSLLPMEKPSNSPANPSIRITLFGISHTSPIGPPAAASAVLFFTARGAVEEGGGEEGAAAGGGGGGGGGDEGDSESALWLASGGRDGTVGVWDALVAAPPE